MTSFDVGLFSRVRGEAGALLRLALPVTGSMFSINAINLIGASVIGRLGKAEFAAAGYAMAAYYLGFIILLGVMLSIQPRVAAAFGSDDQQGVARASQAGMWLAGLLAAVFLPVAFGASFFLEQSVPQDIRGDLVGLYLRIYALGMPASLVFNALRGVLEGVNKPLPVTIVAVSAMLLSAICSPAVAFGWGPLPAMGFVGAACVVVGSYWLMAIALFLIKRRLLPEVKLPQQEVRAELGQLFRLGWPIGLTLGAEGGMFTTTTLIMSRFGEDALAGHNAAFQIITSVFMIVMGIAVATSVRVGHSFGAKNTSAARFSGLIGMGLAILLMGVISLVYFFAPQGVIGLFLNLKDPANAQSIMFASSFLMIAILFQSFDGLQATANAALRGLQDTRIPLIISLIAYWVLGVGGGMLLAFQFDVGPRGLWFGLTVGLCFAGIMLMLRFLRFTGPNRKEL